MGHGVKNLVRSWPDSDDVRQWLITPRSDLVLESEISDQSLKESAQIAIFEQSAGPFTTYRRVVSVSDNPPTLT